MADYTIELREGKPRASGDDPKRPTVAELNKG